MRMMALTFEKTEAILHNNSLYELNRTWIKRDAERHVCDCAFKVMFKVARLRVIDALQQHE